jgi:hypothetical protein
VSEPLNWNRIAREAGYEAVPVMLRDIQRRLGYKAGAQSLGVSVTSLYQKMRREGVPMGKRGQRTCPACGHKF